MLLDLTTVLVHSGFWTRDAILESELVATGMVMGMVNPESITELADKLSDAMVELGKTVAFGYDVVDALKAVLAEAA